jgi:uncharacterized protein (DUF1697 family)
LAALVRSTPPSEPGDRMSPRIQTWAALLRGVNVGNSRRIAMVELRDVVARLGYSNVRTLLNSGNLLFDAPAAEARNATERIRAAVAARFGVAPKVFLRSADAIAALVSTNPLHDVATDPSKLIVVVFDGRSAAASLRTLAAVDWTPERFALTPAAAYLWCPQGLSGGRLGDAAFRALGDEGTTRTLATLTRLLVLATPAA